MNLLIDDGNNWLKQNPKMQEIIENVIMAVLDEEAFSKKVEISITLTDDEEIKEINAQHRNINQVTDVISFPQIDWERYESEPSGYTRPEKKDIILGDIVISIDRLIEQAADYNHSLERELGFLLAHSMFHLLGYDHMEEKEEEQMIEKQEAVLGKLGLVR